MKISIITVTYNSEDTLEETLNSVIDQDHRDVEYIIVDGASSDGTLELLDKYSDGISQMISEKDEGLYFALNKGIEMASGEIVGILHSDDAYTDNTVLSKVVSRFEDRSDLQGLYADLTFVDRTDPSKVIRSWKAGAYKDGDFKKGWMPPHPTFFVRNEVYKTHGGFDTSFELSADYELMLRLIHKNKIRIDYLPESIVNMKMGGVSNTSVWGKVKANLEDKRAWKVNDLNPGFLTTIRKPLSKVGQYFKIGG